jgi:precorrin-2 dehydrogenase / sirohydrochlorin ferrochelatase
MKTKNELYPIFLKANQIEMLIVGGGKVALEKLTFLLKSSPKARVKVVAEEFLYEIKALAIEHNVQLIEHSYSANFLKDVQLVIAATNNKEINKKIHSQAKALRIPINVADTPDLCDFYLGSIVTKGNIKIAISTNGKSPTLAKRLRELLEASIPDNINDLAESLHIFRKQLKSDFTKKVNTLNELTASLIKPTN